MMMTRTIWGTYAVVAILNALSLAAEERLPQKFVVDLAALAKEAEVLIVLDREENGQRVRPGVGEISKDLSGHGNDVAIARREFKTGYTSDQPGEGDVVRLETVGQLPRGLLNGRAEYTLVAWVRKAAGASVPLYRELTAAGDPRMTVLLTARDAMRFGIFKEGVDGGGAWVQGVVDAKGIPAAEWFLLALRLERQANRSVMTVIVNDREFPVDGGVLNYKGDGQALIGSFAASECDFRELALFPRALKPQELAAIRQMVGRTVPLDLDSGKLEVVVPAQQPSQPPPAVNPKVAAPLKKVIELRGPKKSINRVRFFSESRTIVAVSDDPALWIWDVATGKLKQTFPIDATPREVSASPDGTRVAVGGKGPVKLYSVETGAVIRELAPAAGECHGITFTPDGLQILFTQGRLLTKQDVATGNNVVQLETPHDTTRGLSLSADGERLATAGINGPTVWEVASMKPLSTFLDHSRFKTYDVDLSPDLQTAVSCSGEPTLLVWNVADAKKSQTMVGHKEGIKSVRFLLDGQRIASGGYDGTLRVWDVKSGQQLWMAENLGSNHITVSADGRYLACGGGYISRNVSTPELESLAVTVFEVQPVK